MESRRRFLVVVPQQEGGERAIEHAVMMARQNGAELTVVDVLSYLDAYTMALRDVIDVSGLRQLVLEHRENQLRRQLAAYDDEIARNAEVRVLDGVPFIEIIREAIRSGCHLILKMSDREGASRRRSLGSTDMHLIRKSPLPVFAINAARSDTARRVLVAVDSMARDDEARNLQRKTLRLAADIAAATDAKLLVLSTWELVGEESMRNSPFLKIDDARIDSLLQQTEYRARNAQDLLARWFEQELPYAARPQWHVIKGSARQVIPDFIASHGIDLLVMGSVAQAGIPGLLIGSTAESVLGDINCSVLTAKPDGFNSPIELEAVQPVATPRPAATPRLKAVAGT